MKQQFTVTMTVTVDTSKLDKPATEASVKRNVRAAVLGSGFGYVVTFIDAVEKHAKPQ
jgi:hypothetical protein